MCFFVTWSLILLVAMIAVGIKAGLTTGRSEEECEVDEDIYLAKLNEINGKLDMIGATCIARSDKQSDENVS